MTPVAPDLDPETRDRLQAAKAAFWLAGDLSYLLRPHGQRQVYERVHELKDRDPDRLTTIPVNCHRRLGKTTVGGLILGIERCLRYPGQFVKFAAPTTKQTTEIVIPNLAPILADCPLEIHNPRSDQKKVDKKWVFHNPAWPEGSEPSVFGLYGCDVDGGERLRGPAADFWILDEVREVRNLQYLVSNILLYQFIGRHLPLLLMLSTPPKTMVHDFVRVYIERGRREGTYIEMPASRNPDFTEEDRELVLSEIGGDVTSPSYRREAECELISETEELIVPEYPPRRDDIVVDEYERPGYFAPLAAMDVGWVDNTAILWGYVDFFAQILVIEHEIVAHYKTTAELAALTVDLEREHYAGVAHPLWRYADAPKIVVNDLSRSHRLFFREVQKWDRDQAIASLRGVIAAGKLRVHRRCKNLDTQLQYGVWNKSRKDFERSEALGHCDALMALVYLNRMVRWDFNPYPAGVVDKERHWAGEPEKRVTSDVFLEALGRKGR